MPSFDVVSEVDKQEFRNALDHTERFWQGWDLLKTVPEHMRPEQHSGETK